MRAIAPRTERTASRFCDGKPSVVETDPELRDRIPTGYRADAALPWSIRLQDSCDVDPVIGAWLADGGSLTRRLVRLSDGQFHVQILEEGWQRADRLSLQDCFPAFAMGRLMWSRSVLLCGRDQPWVVAHTLIPVDSLRGGLRQLSRLSDRPLGSILFRQRQIHRGAMQFAAGDEGVPGRRSLFRRGNRPLLVAEFFLPALQRIIIRRG